MLYFVVDIKRLYYQAGVENKPTVFLFTDTQALEETFLEDISNILSSGEVPNLYKADEFEEVMRRNIQYHHDIELDYSYIDRELPQWFYDDNDDDNVHDDNDMIMIMMVMTMKIMIMMLMMIMLRITMKIMVIMITILMLKMIMMMKIIIMLTMIQMIIITIMMT